MYLDARAPRSRPRRLDRARLSRRRRRRVPATATDASTSTSTSIRSARAAAASSPSYDDDVSPPFVVASAPSSIAISTTTTTTNATGFSIRIHLVVAPDAALSSRVLARARSRTSTSTTTISTRSSTVDGDGDRRRRRLVETSIDRGGDECGRDNAPRASERAVTMATMARVRARVDARARVGARGGERAVRGRARTRRWEKRGGGGERTRARTTTTRAKRGRGGGGGGGGGQATLVAEAMYVELDLDVVGLEGEAWKLDQAAEAIRAGEVGIIPTDTKYAFVADLTNQNAVQKLYDIKNAGLNKPLSILCRGFQDIDAYTTGFPSNPKPGMPLPFKLAKQCLPGPYTLILPASKELPKVCLMDKSTKDKARQCKSRKTVGVRIPDCDVTRALLDLLDAPLMCSTVPECDEDPAVIYDTYLPRGLGFLIDIGQRHANAASTVVDLSDGDARVLRAGAGEPDLWASMDEDDSVDNDPDAAWGFA